MEFRERKLGLIIVLAGVIISAGALIFSSAALPFYEKTEAKLASSWIEQTGEGFSAPACGSATANVTCSNGLPVVTFPITANHGLDTQIAITNSPFTATYVTAASTIDSTSLEFVWQQNKDNRWNYIMWSPPQNNQTYEYSIDGGLQGSFTTPNCAAVPPQPTNLKASCPAPGTSAALTWDQTPGATYYNSSADHTSDEVPFSCSNLQPGEFCLGGYTNNSYTFSSFPGPYVWVLTACNSAGCGPSNSLAFTCEPPPISCPLSADPGDTLINFTPYSTIVSNEFLYEHKIGPFSTNLPAGNYDTKLVSYDYHVPGGSGWQNQLFEQYFLKLFDSSGGLVAKTPSTPDIPNDKNYEQITINSFNIPSPVSKIEAWHSYYPDPDPDSYNSLVPVCALFKPVPRPITIKATNIICDNETDLPNWSFSGKTIDSTTASEFLDSHPQCSPAPGWDFQWAPADASALPGDFVGRAGGPWTTFDRPTDGNGVTQTTIDSSQAKGSVFWIREALKPGFQNFTAPPDNPPNDVSAEMWCWRDVEFYDNFDHVDFQNYPLPGDVYNCIALNVRSKQSMEDYSLSADPRGIFVNIQGGGNSISSKTKITATSFNGFSGNEKISVYSVSPNIPGAIHHFVPSNGRVNIPSGGSDSLDYWIEIPASTPGGTYVITFAGTGGSNPRVSVTLNVEVLDPNFREVFIPKKLNRG